MSRSMFVTYQLTTNKEQTPSKPANEHAEEACLFIPFFFPCHLLETLVLTTLVLINVRHKTKTAKKEEAYLLRSTTVW